MTDTALLPCPFCGAGSDRIILTMHEPHTHSIATFMPNHPGSATIECGGCNVGMIEDDAEKVTAAWNRRAQLAAPVASTPITIKELVKSVQAGEKWTVGEPEQLAAPAAPTDQQIVDCLARHGIGWGDEQGVTAYPLDGEDAPVYIGAVRELLAAPASEPMVPVEEVKSLCRDYSSRTGSVYIKDVESELDALAALYAAPQGAAHD